MCPILGGWEVNNDQKNQTSFMYVPLDKTHFRALTALLATRFKSK